MKTLILCGGKGTRSYPFTELFPKVMMPVNGTPIIVHLMRIYAQQGFDEFVLAAGHRKELLIDYFDGRFPNWDVRIVDTGDDSDTGERVFRCRKYLDQRFFATYGDGLGDLDLHDLRRAHDESEGVATLTTVPLRSQYGLVVYDENNRVHRFEEKPVVPNYWINAGFFAFEPSAFDDWHGTNLERDVLPHFARRQQLYVHKHHGFWKSMDTSKDQQELESLCTGGVSPWTPQRAVSTIA